ncbi:MupA/Atu3671 family FMN-dependent luciferase-like monooxygenase [Paenibacillus pabuli]|uniref:MupA/Atu3671 family FMN-dependent luciferase-like monooxygenase n=1 Tax=Paenibacillus pabuli TaxID=1472 RepID=UPI003CECCFD0
MDFSLFFFSSYESGITDDKYKLLLDTTSYADRHGFSAVWTPERHFHEFGGLFPNPSIVAAALAMVTKNVQLRAGSIVSPLHDPLRIAEEWAVVDNLSGGRVGVSFASGWHADDFVLRPDGYADRKQLMFEHMEQVKKLWKGEAISRVNGLGKTAEVKTYPRPLQDDLPIWVTSGGNRETFVEAGRQGANVLTHLLGQDIPLLEANIHAYRQALQENGFSADSGKVALMLHTFIGDDQEQVRQKVKGPFKEYLRSSLSLIRNLAEDIGIDESAMDDPDIVEKILEMAFNKYWQTSALLGTPDRCADMINRLAKIGVDEAACLIDFGVEQQEVMNSLERLGELKKRFAVDNSNKPRDGYEGIKPVSMIQCTPSHLSMMVANPDSKSFLASLKTILVGGEAFPSSLANKVRNITDADIYNMYGPTETTVWSMMHKIRESDHTIPIGKPIGNTSVYILDQHLRVVPIGAVGDIYIGGLGVSRGYLGKDELTAERFIADPFSKRTGDRLYKTGDLGKYRSDGTIDYLGREDFQVKIRGYRIELGDIEAKLIMHENVSECVVTKLENKDEDGYLCAYYVSDSELADQELRTYLLNYLPVYMIPSRFVRLDFLPLSVNGKVNRKALPVPSEVSLSNSPDHAIEKSRMEKIVLQAWSEIAQLNIRGMEDNFFDIGGNSVAIVKINVNLKELTGLNIPIVDMFRYPTIRTLAKYLEQLASGTNTDNDIQDRTESINQGKNRMMKRIQKTRRLTIDE